MTQEDKDIVSAALKYEEGSSFISERKAFLTGALSEEAKLYHTKDTFTYKQVESICRKVFYCRGNGDKDINVNTLIKDLINDNK